MHIARQIAAGSGALMACALITLISMTQSQWVKDHPAGAERLGIALLVGAVACFIFWAITRGKQQGTAIKTEANFVGRDNTGKMIGHVEHYHEATVSSAFPPPRIEAPPQPRVFPKKELREPPPSLGLGFVPRVKIDRDGQVFRFDEQGQQGLALSVLNLPAPQTGFASDLTSVFAMLTFDQAGRRSTVINRACWIGREANEIPIEVGDTAHVLLGFSVESCWLCFNNPNKYGYDVVEWNHPMLDLEARTIDWIDWEPIEVEILIISTAQASKGQTIAHRKFQLRREGISYSARWLT